MSNLLVRSVIQTWLYEDVLDLYGDRQTNSASTAGSLHQDDIKVGY
jgi:hypothetical protein